MTLNRDHISLAITDDHVIANTLNLRYLRGKNIRELYSVDDARSRIRLIYQVQTVSLAEAINISAHPAS